MEAHLLNYLLYKKKIDGNVKIEIPSISHCHNNEYQTKRKKGKRQEVESSDLKVIFRLKS